jgi:hypothetical protein
MTTSAILGVDKQDMIMPKQRRNWGLIIAIIISGVLLGGIGAAGVSIYQRITHTTTALGGVATTTPATATSAGNNVPYAARSARSDNPTITVIATATPEPQAEARTATQLSGATIPCDGRGVLIIHSIVDTGQDIGVEARSVLTANPGAQLLQPGACSSLRASLDGNDVYGIVIDYGFDTDRLCRAAASIGGNPRTMNNSGDFTSPC